MDRLSDTALLLARALLASVFIVAGYGKLGDVAGFSGYMASGGIPAILGWPVVLFELLAGVALLLGLFTRPVALALAAFCLVAGLLYHYVPGDQMQMIMFMKNLGLTGGFLAVAAAGAGRFAMDARIGRAFAPA